HFQHSAEPIDRRLAKGTAKEGADIWAFVLDKSTDVISRSEIHANASVLMVAGTETTVTLLSGMTYHLLENPEKLRKAVEEVRALSEVELTLEQLSRLQHLDACFEVGLRMYPPVRNGMHREVGESGNAICGEGVPEKTRVIVSQWASFR
ncbi:P450-type monooxygenase/dehydrogenase, partial [Macrophomina phaseolina]